MERDAERHKMERGTDIGWCLVKAMHIAPLLEGIAKRSGMEDGQLLRDAITLIWRLNHLLDTREPPPLRPEQIGGKMLIVLLLRRVLAQVPWRRARP